MDIGNSSVMELRFLPGLGRTYNKEIRAFVLQKYMAKRKKRAYARNSAKDQDDGDLLQADKVVTGPSKWRSIEDGEWQMGSAPGDSAPPINTRLGMGRVDPFRTYARDTNSFENAMIDEYLMNVYTWFGLRRSQSFCPSRDLMFPNNIQQKISMLAMIAYGASTYERQRGVQPKESARYCAMTIREINRQLQLEFESPGDSLLLTVCGLICMTIETKSRQTIREEVGEIMAHAQGLRAMIATRGGWNFARSYHQHYLSWLIVWVDILLGGVISAGSTVLSQHIYSVPSLFHRHPKLSSGASNPLIHYPEELIGAYADFYHAALRRQKCPKYLSWPREPARRLPCDLFQPPNACYRLLSSTESVYLRRIVPLVYINIMLWAYRDLPAKTLDELYRHYAKNISASDVDLASSNEVFLWGLTTDVETKRLMHVEWIELMTRIQHVEAKLEPKTQERLAETLLEFVVHATQPDGLDLVANWWTPEQFAEVVREELRDA